MTILVPVSWSITSQQNTINLNHQQTNCTMFIENNLPVDLEDPNHVEVILESATFLKHCTNEQFYLTLK
jgi:hypothetical protein